MSRSARPVFSALPPEASVTQRVTGFLGEMTRQRHPERALGKDPYLAALAQATIKTCLEDDNLPWMLREIFAFRQKTRTPAEPVNYSRDVNLFQKSVCYALEVTDAERREMIAPDPITEELMQLPLYFYDTPEGWERGLRIILNKSDNAAEKFYTSMALRNVATNIEQRYVAIKLAMSLFKDRFNHPMRCLDVGTSLGLGPKQVSLPHPSQHPFQPITMAVGGLRTPRGLPKLDGELTSISNERLSLPMPAQWLGVDIWLTDKQARPWAVSNRFRPAEKDPQALEEYKEFVDLTVPYLETAELDILAKAAEVDEVLDGVPYDVAVFSTIGNQLTPTQLTKALKNVKRHMSHHGLIFMQDFVWPDPGQRNGLRFDTHWGVYNTLVYDMAHREAGWQHIFLAENGRALAYASAFGMVALQPNAHPRTMEEHLRAAA